MSIDDCFELIARDKQMFANEICQEHPITVESFELERQQLKRNLVGPERGSIHEASSHQSSPVRPVREKASDRIRLRTPSVSVADPGSQDLIKYLVSKVRNRLVSGVLVVHLDIDSAVIHRLCVLEGRSTADH